MTPKEIAQVLEKMRFMYNDDLHGRTNTPKFTEEAINKPSHDNTVQILKLICEWAYDTDLNQRKAKLDRSDIHDEALEVVFLFTLTRQLSLVGGVDDFFWKDIWEPNSKKLRALLSGIINFCRYKEKKMMFLEPIEAEHQVLDCERVEIAHRCDELLKECLKQQLVFEQLVPGRLAAEQEALACQDVLEKLQSERQVLDRTIEEKERSLKAKQDREAQLQQRATELRELMANLEEQIAERPSSVEQDIQDLQDSRAAKKAWVEEKLVEKRARAQRDQVLARMQHALQNYTEALGVNVKLQQKLDTTAEISKRASKERDQIVEVRQQREAEIAELQKLAQETDADIAQAGQVHRDDLDQLEARRQAAVEQFKQYQEKASEEEREVMAVEAQVLELEGQIVSSTREHEVQVTELVNEMRAAADERKAYTLNYEDAIQSYDPEAYEERLRIKQVMMSPSPARTLRSPYGGVKLPAADRLGMKPRELLRSP